MPITWKIWYIPPIRSGKKCNSYLWDGKTTLNLKSWLQSRFVFIFKSLTITLFMPVNKVSLMLAHQTLLSAWRVIHSEMSPIPSIAERDLLFFFIYNCSFGQSYTPLALHLPMSKNQRISELITAKVTGGIMRKEIHL